MKRRENIRHFPGEANPCSSGVYIRREKAMSVELKQSISDLYQQLTQLKEYL